MRQERRRLENERRLEGQLLEHKRKLEARRKAEEALASACAPSEGKERSTNGGELPSQRCSRSEEECREDAKGGSPTVAVKVVDDQKVHIDDDAETVSAPGRRVLGHDTGETCLAITGEEHSKTHLIMMAHVSFVSIYYHLRIIVTDKPIINRIPPS